MASPEARVLVLFLDDTHAQDLFQEMINRNVESGYFQIIASDSWGSRTDFIPGLEAPAVGMFIHQYKDFLKKNILYDLEIDDCNPNNLFFVFII